MSLSAETRELLQRVYNTPLGRKKGEPLVADDNDLELPAPPLKKTVADSLARDAHRLLKRRGLIPS